eukprot:tig00021072_g17967.t1
MEVEGAASVASPPGRVANDEAAGGKRDANATVPIPDAPRRIHVVAPDRALMMESLVASPPAGGPATAAQAAGACACACRLVGSEPDVFVCAKFDPLSAVPGARPGADLFKAAPTRRALRDLCSAAGRRGWFQVAHRFCAVTAGGSVASVAYLGCLDLDSPGICGAGPKAAAAAALRGARTLSDFLGAEPRLLPALEAGRKLLRACRARGIPCLLAFSGCKGFHATVADARLFARVAGARVDPATAKVDSTGPGGARSCGWSTAALLDRVLKPFLSGALGYSDADVAELFSVLDKGPLAPNVGMRTDETPHPLTARFPTAVADPDAPDALAGSPAAPDPAVARFYDFFYGEFVRGYFLREFDAAAPGVVGVDPDPAADRAAAAAAAAGSGAPAPLGKRARTLGGPAAAPRPVCDGTGLERAVLRAAAERLGLGHRAIAPAERLFFLYPSDRSEGDDPCPHFAASPAPAAAGAPAPRYTHDWKPATLSAPRESGIAHVASVTAGCLGDNHCVPKCRDRPWRGVLVWKGRARASAESNVEDRAACARIDALLADLAEYASSGIDRAVARVGGSAPPAPRTGPYALRFDAFTDEISIFADVPCPGCGRVLAPGAPPGEKPFAKIEADSDAGRVLLRSCGGGGACKGKCAGAELGPVWRSELRRRLDAVDAEVQREAAALFPALESGSVGFLGARGPSPWRIRVDEDSPLSKETRRVMGVLESGPAALQATPLEAIEEEAARKGDAAQRDRTRLRREQRRAFRSELLPDLFRPLTPTVPSPPFAPVTWTPAIAHDGNARSHVDSEAIRGWFLANGPAARRLLFLRAPTSTGKSQAISGLMWAMRENPRAYGVEEDFRALHLAAGRMHPNEIKSDERYTRKRVRTDDGDGPTAIPSWARRRAVRAERDAADPRFVRVEMPWTSYQEVGPDTLAEQVAQLLSTLESLHRFRTEGRPFGAVFLDEIALACARLALSSTLLEGERQERARETLEWLLATATILVCSDADLCQPHVDYLVKAFASSPQPSSGPQPDSSPSTRAAPAPALLVAGEYLLRPAREERRAILFPYAYGPILAAALLRSGQRVVLSSDNRRGLFATKGLVEADPELRRRDPEVRFLMIWAGASEEDKARIADKEFVGTVPDILAYNSSLPQGTNLDWRTRIYDYVLVMWQGKTYDVNGKAQALARVRHVRCKNLLVCIGDDPCDGFLRPPIAPSKVSLAATLAEILDDVRERRMRAAAFRGVDPAALLTPMERAFAEMAALPTAVRRYGLERPEAAADAKFRAMGFVNGLELAGAVLTGPQWKEVANQLKGVQAAAAEKLLVMPIVLAPSLHPIRQGEIERAMRTGRAVSRPVASEQLGPSGVPLGAHGRAVCVTTYDMLAVQRAICARRHRLEACAVGPGDAADSVSLAPNKLWRVCKAFARTVLPLRASSGVHAERAGRIINPLHEDAHHAVRSAIRYIATLAEASGVRLLETVLSSCDRGLFGRLFDPKLPPAQLEAIAALLVGEAPLFGPACDARRRIVIGARYLAEGLPDGHPEVRAYCEVGLPRGAKVPSLEDKIRGYVVDLAKGAAAKMGLRLGAIAKDGRTRAAEANPDAGWMGLCPVTMAFATAYAVKYRFAEGHYRRAVHADAAPAATAAAGGEAGAGAGAGDRDDACDSDDESEVDPGPEVEIANDEDDGQDGGSEGDEEGYVEGDAYRAAASALRARLPGQLALQLESRDARGVAGGAARMEIGDAAGSKGPWVADAVLHYGTANLTAVCNAAIRESARPESKRKPLSAVFGERHPALWCGPAVQALSPEGDANRLAEALRALRGNEAALCEAARRAHGALLDAISTHAADADRRHAETSPAVSTQAMRSLLAALSGRAHQVLEHPSAGESDVAWFLRRLADAARERAAPPRMLRHGGREYAFFEVGSIFVGPYARLPSSGEPVIRRGKGNGLRVVADWVAGRSLPEMQLVDRDRLQLSKDRGPKYDIRWHVGVKGAWVPRDLFAALGVGVSF